MKSINVGRVEVSIGDDEKVLVMIARDSLSLTKEDVMDMLHGLDRLFLCNQQDRMIASLLSERKRCV